MKHIALLQNTIQEYAWGSTTAIAQLMGRPEPADQPQAELWMGAHPKAVSRVLCHGLWRSLQEVIAENPEQVLGKTVSRRFSAKLPFLFKVLAAARPLSIQAHPNRQQARQGFVRENQLGIPLEASHRNYRDDNHKPEIICALTRFWALKGFRRIEQILTRLDELQISSLAREIESLRRQPNQEGLRDLFQHLLAMDKGRQALVLGEALASAQQRASKDLLCSWMMRLNQAYPGDIGILSAILLNLVKLEPGQAVYLPAGEPHAYLEGVGIELMANSDNVLRGGLTPKYIDVDELLKILDFTDKDVDILTPKKMASGEAVYQTPAAEFVLAVIGVSDASPFRSDTGRSVEIMICTAGEARVTDLADGGVTSLPRGSSIIVPAAVKQYEITGNATLYKAAVPC